MTKKRVRFGGDLGPGRPEGVRNLVGKVCLNSKWLYFEISLKQPVARLEHGVFVTLLEFMGSQK